MTLGTWRCYGCCFSTHYWGGGGGGGGGGGDGGKEGVREGGGGREEGRVGGCFKDPLEITLKLTFFEKEPRGAWRMSRVGRGGRLN